MIATQATCLPRICLVTRPLCPLLEHWAKWQTGNTDVEGWFWTMQKGGEISIGIWQRLILRKQKHIHSRAEGIWPILCPPTLLIHCLLWACDLQPVMSMGSTGDTVFLPSGFYKKFLWADTIVWLPTASKVPTHGYTRIWLNQSRYPVHLPKPFATGDRVLTKET